MSMVRSSIHTAGRVFAELDACDAAIDKAAESAANVADRLQAAVAAENSDAVSAELSKLKELIAEVRRFDEPRRLMNRVLGRAETEPHRYGQVPKLTLADLPDLPSSYSDGEFDDLMAMAQREAELAPRLAAAHAERIARTGRHLEAVVQQLAQTGFADREFTRAMAREAEIASGLWHTCLLQRMIRDRL
ncbi:hypothetical protein [Streptomyces sp. NPDC050738]|uniref:hypothetical protein n=1 Tax=Streptomyces sp. NPDC050738 TaxID=3154744 RepID=UPI0034489061